MSQSGGASGLIIGFIALPLALYFVASALRPGALTTDDTGLRLRRAFGTQRIPWAAVRGFRMVKRGRAGPPRAGDSAHGRGDLAASHYGFGG
jgi:hypothetical protein